MCSSARRSLLSLALLAPLGAPASAQCEVADLVHPNAFVFGAFGSAAAMDGGLAAVGAFQVDALAGKAYVFELGPSGWSEVATLEAWDAPVFAFFGAALALEGNRLVVGAPAQGGAPLASGPGAVYVFERGPAGWAPIQKLVASDGVPKASFGAAVALEGGRIVVGAPNAGFVPGAFFGPGAAYVFDLGPGGWSQVAKIDPGGPLPPDHFGGAVALSGDDVLVGTRQVDPGPFGGGAAQGPGIVAVHSASAAWARTATLTGSLGGNLDGFGSALSVEGDELLVGAPLPAPGFAFGRAFVFDRGPSGWVETAVLAAGSPNDEFGASVALSRGRAIVAAPEAPNALPGHDGPGAAFTLADSPGGWIVTARLKPSNESLDEGYALSAALDGDVGLVGGWNFAHVVSLGGACPSLFASPPLLLGGAAGVQYLTLRAGAANAGLLYVVLGSLSGTSPGVAAGGVTLPLNVDSWFLYTLQAANGPVMQGTLGLFDGAGAASARIVKPALLPPAVGLVFDHAYAVLDLSGPVPVGVFASNPVPLTIL